MRIKRKAQSTFEYITVLALVMLALLAFQKYIVRGMSGRFVTVGQSFGSGRLYDPKSIKCAINPKYSNQWYNSVCFDENCVDSCYSVRATASDCADCIEVTCAQSKCN